MVCLQESENSPETAIVDFATKVSNRHETGPHKQITGPKSAIFQTGQNITATAKNTVLFSNSSSFLLAAIL